MKDHRILLVSASPRRKELLTMMGIDFKVNTNTDFEEIVPDGMAPEDVPSYFAEQKSLHFNRPVADDEILISADTVVICDGKILGKPHHRDKAKEMLRSLSGKTHKVVSAVCVRTPKGIQTLSDTTLVTFKSLNDNEIDYYVESFKPVDKAGGYGIQEWIGAIGITKIEGSYYTVMGLPTHLVYALLQKMA